MYQLEKLTNGLTLLRIPVDNVESIATLVLARTGSRYEASADYGLAHFLEHIVFKGTKKFSNTKILSETVDSIGAQFNAFTSEELTGFYLRSASKDLDLSLDVLGQLITQPLIEPAEIERERGVILEEMHMYEDDPASYNDILFNQLFYAQSGLAHNVLGTPTAIAKITRDDFERYLNTWYGPDNLLVVVAGKTATINQPELVNKIEASFQFAAARQAHPDQKQFWEKQFHYGERLGITKRKTEQIHLTLAWPGLKKTDPREETLGLLSTIIGGNMSSRLFIQVRERLGLCYYIRSQTDLYADSGSFGVSAGLNPEKLLEAIKVTLTQFQQLVTGEQAITAQELQKAKNYLTGQLTLAQESVLSLATAYGSRYLATGEIEEVNNLLNKINQVTLEDLHQLARDLIQPGEARLSLIGPITAKQEKELQTLLYNN